MVDDAKDQIEDKADEVGETLDKAKSKIVQNWGRTIQESSSEGPPIRKIRMLQ